MNVTSSGLRPMSVAYLDLIRGLSANLVLAEHAHRIYFGPPRWPLAMIGVTLFFLISGFLILNSAWRRLDRPGPQMEAFLIDRICRIYTAFLPALVFAAVMSVLVVSGKWGQPGITEGPVAFLGNALLLNDYPIFQVVSRLTGSYEFHIRSYETAEPFWTIPVEFWIYVAFAGLAFVIIRGQPPKGILMPILFLMAIPVVLWNAFAGGGDSLTVLWSIGAFFGYIFIRSSALSRLRAIALGVLIAGFGFFALIGRIAQNGFNGYEVQTTIFIAMLIFGLLQLIERIGRSASFLPALVRAFAIYSYSLYLVHNTILIIAFEHLKGLSPTTSLAIGVVAAHSVAILFYWCFERHHKTVAYFLKARLPRRSSRAESALAVVDSVKAQPVWHPA